MRYAVVGLGWIAQESILPAFARARANSDLHALVSDDPTKLRILGRKYGVTRLYSYEEYERCLRDVDAVFIALPKLCEKPMAVTERDARAMLRACARERHLFGAEPVEAFGEHVRGRGARFRQVPEATAAVLRFPGDRIASFTSSFGAEGRSSYEVFGTKGPLRLRPLRRPRLEQETHRPAGGSPRLVRADDPRPE